MQFPSKLGDRLPHQCNMAAWMSPLHFRVSTGTKLRTELQREDEQKWDLGHPKSGSAKRPRRRATQQRSQQAQTTDAQTSKKMDPAAKPKNETDSRPVPPRGSVAVMATRSAGVQTEDPVWGSLSLWHWLAPATVTCTATQTLDDGRSLHQGVPSRGSIG